MKKKLLILFIAACFCFPSYGRHIAGGEIFYEYLGVGLVPGTSQYRITLRLFRDCQSTGAQLDPQINMGIFDKIGNTPVPGYPFSVLLDRTDIVQKGGNIPCIINAPIVCYQVGYYFLTVTLPNNQAGYWVSFQRCCRVDNITNLSLAIGTGATYLGSIAGTNDIGTGVNSSPQFLLKDTALVCQNRNFNLDFGAIDPDGDRLTYAFCEAYDGGSTGSPTVPNPSAPPFGILPYGSGYSSFSPLGSNSTINPNTGLISGRAPAAGSYVIAVCVSEWRNGRVINTHRKDFMLKVADCDFVAAQLPLSATYCDDFVTSFENLSPSPLIFAWRWDFGVPGVTNDTSILALPTYTYADTGTYTVKLVVNPGDQCSDSATMRLGVYPGFFPDFTELISCVNRPTQFNDQTTSRYGTVNSWRWDFGEPIVAADTSRTQNPSYAFPTVGPKTVQLIVGSTKGCVDTTYKDIIILDKPVITLPFRDTLICLADTLSIPVTGNGVFNWTPNSNIQFANTANPSVYPATNTIYNVVLNDNGCINNDSVRVRVISAVTLKIRSDTTFCRGDGVQLGAESDGLRFSWAPNIDLSDPTIINPIANPSVATTYQLTAFVGGCSVTDFVRISLADYPTVNAGPDLTICYNNPVQLTGNVIATNFFWKPQGSLNNANVLNPIGRPTITTRYILTATDTLGCPKPGTDTVLVTVLPKVLASAGNDTSIVANQPLQLNASGGENYRWTPPTGLSNVNIANPIARLNEHTDSIRFNVFVTDQIGCLDSASILVKVFTTNPQIFVPTGFTPNNDGLNDILKPIGVGIDRIEYFRVYNRWGQLVFSTTRNGHGWDGRIAGKNQTTGTFVWIVKAVDYTGKSVFQKGTSTLIR